MDLEIKYNEELVKDKYERLNWQTAKFIERFNLDQRIFVQDRQAYLKTLNLPDMSSIAILPTKVSEEEQKQAIPSE